jgi:hypothetical protein
MNQAARLATQSMERSCAEDSMFDVRLRRIAVIAAMAATILLPFHASTLRAQDAAPNAPTLATPKQAPPPGSAPKAFTVPAHETYSLPNGMKVTLVPYGNIPKVTVSLALRTGNIDETSEKLGLADITGELMKEGTKSMTSEQVAQAAAQMGSSLGVGVGVDETTVAMDVLSESGPASVKLIADVVENPLLPESELARIKTNMLRQIAVSKRSPRRSQSLAFANSCTAIIRTAMCYPRKRASMALRSTTHTNFTRQTSALPALIFTSPVNSTPRR